jgi:hypothetical protein
MESCYKPPGNNDSDYPNSNHRVLSLNELVPNSVTDGASCSFASHLHAHVLLRWISNRAHSLLITGLQISEAPRTPHYQLREPTNGSVNVWLKTTTSKRCESPNIVTGFARKLVVWVSGIGKGSSKKRERERAFFARFAPENLASCDFWWCYGILTLWGISIVSLKWNVRVCKCELVILAQSRWGSLPCIRSKKPREAWFQRFNHFSCELWRPKHPPNIPTKWTKPTLDLGEFSPDQIRSLYEHMKPYQSCQLREMEVVCECELLIAAQSR